MGGQRKIVSFSDVVLCVLCVLCGEKSLPGAPHLPAEAWSDAVPENANPPSPGYLPPLRPLRPLR